MSEKNALVTGANRGLGLEVSKQSAEQDYHVFMGARNLSAKHRITLAKRSSSDGH